MSRRQNHSPKTLDSLSRVYLHRRNVLQQGLAPLIDAVRVSEAELSERRGLLDTLEAQAKRTHTYMETQSFNGEAATFERSLRYLSALDHDMQRERYYVELTEDELTDKLEDLARHRRKIAALEARMDAVADFGEAARRGLLRRQETRADDSVSESGRHGALT